MRAADAPGNDQQTIAALLESAFAALDQRLLAELGEKAFSVGSTATVVLHFPALLAVANLGDGRALLARDGQALCLSATHTTANAAERERLARCGAEVSDERVMGVLAVTRSVGDFQFKAASGHFAIGADAVSAVPEVRFAEVNARGDAFLLIGSDGLFAAIGDAALVEGVERARRASDEFMPQLICEELAKSAVGENLRTLRDSDNVSAILVFLSRGQFREQFWRE